MRCHAELAARRATARDETGGDGYYPGQGRTYRKYQATFHATPPERPPARRSAVQRHFRWCWTGVSGWGRVAAKVPRNPVHGDQLVAAAAIDHTAGVARRKG